jgi:hypothetical protein
MSSHKLKSIKLNISTLQFPVGNFLGWNVFSSGTVIPANNVVIKDNTRIAIFLDGSNGQVISSPFTNTLSFVSLLSSLNIYNTVLALTYSSNLSGEQGAGDFVADQLSQLLKLKNLAVDVYGFSNGTFMVRYSMEARKLGKYPQFRNAILGGSFSEGIYPGAYTNFTDPNLQVSLAIQESFLGIIVAGSYASWISGTTPVLSNSSFDTRYPGAGSLITHLNKHKVSKKIYENLKYYTISGTDDLANAFSVATLETLFGPNPYVTLAFLAGVTGSGLTLAASFQTLYPSIGLLQQYSNTLLPAKQPLIGDGVVVAKNEVLKTKSEFYKKHPYETDLYVPQNHFGLFNVTLPNMTQFWTSVIKSLQDGGECESKTNDGCICSTKKLDLQNLDPVIKDTVSKLKDAKFEDYPSLITKEYLQKVQEKLTKG